MCASITVTLPQTASREKACSNFFERWKWDTHRVNGKWAIDLNIADTPAGELKLFSCLNASVVPYWPFAFATLLCTDFTSPIWKMWTAITARLTVRKRPCHYRRPSPICYTSSSCRIIVWGFINKITLFHPHAVRRTWRKKRGQHGLFFVFFVKSLKHFKSPQ